MAVIIYLIFTASASESKNTSAFSVLLLQCTWSLTVLTLTCIYADDSCGDSSDALECCLCCAMVIMVCSAQWLNWAGTTFHNLYLAFHHLKLPFHHVNLELLCEILGLRLIAKWLRLDGPHCIFGQLIFWKIVTVVALRGQILRQHSISPGELTLLPRPPSGI